MIHLSKTELEDIWRNKPYGHFQSVKKNLKKSKKYKVVIEPYKQTRYPPETYDMIATSREMAIAMAKLEVETKFKKLGYEIDGFYQSAYEVMR
jgi:hypothetical protein